MLSLEIVDFRVTRNRKRIFQDEMELIRNPENDRIHSTYELGSGLARIGYCYENGLLSVFFANIVRWVGTNPDLYRPFSFFLLHQSARAYS